MAAHVCVCVSHVDTGHMPSLTEKAELPAFAGLGEKKITFTEAECVSDSFFREFSKLHDGSGFEDLRSNGKFLTPLPTPPNEH